MIKSKTKISHKIKEEIKSFCTDSTAHGLGNIAKTDSFLFRIIWIILVILAFSYCSYCEFLKFKFFNIKFYLINFKFK